MRRELHQFVSPRVTGIAANNLVEHLVYVLHFSLDHLTNMITKENWLQICRGPRVMLGDADATVLYEAIRQRRYLLERRQLAKLHAQQSQSQAQSQGGAPRGVGGGAMPPGVAISAVAPPSIESKVGGAVAAPPARRRRGRRTAPQAQAQTAAVPVVVAAAAAVSSGSQSVLSVTAVAPSAPPRRTTVGAPSAVGGGAAPASAPGRHLGAGRSRGSEENLQVISDDAMEQIASSLLGDFDF